MTFGLIFLGVLGSIAIGSLSYDGSEPQNADRPPTFDFEQTQAGGAFTTSIDLTFGETETALKAIASTTLISNTPFTANDIALAVISNIKTA